MSSLRPCLDLAVRAVVMAGVVLTLSACAQSGARFSDLNSGTRAESISARYPEGAIDSIEMADRALGEVRAERPTIRKQLADDERACYERFFTNRCLATVEDRERSALEQLRRIEVEANAFKRRENVRQRDERQTLREPHRLPVPGDPRIAPGMGE